MSSFKYIYGPVSSWRIGHSLGVDLIASSAKICTFDCIYCQLGRKKPYPPRLKAFVPLNKIISELLRLPAVPVDYITFSGMGEPSLAKNLKDAIIQIKKIRKEPIAVLTNSSLLSKKYVRRTLLLADYVICKLDAYSQSSFNKINKPGGKATFAGILAGIKKFKAQYKGKFALQIMFINENKAGLAEFKRLIQEIRPDEVQINSPLRPCGIKPLRKNEILRIKKYFQQLKGIKIISVYDKRPPKANVINTAETKKRRGAV